MNRALFIKELRECLPIAALGVLAAIYALLQHTGWSLIGQPINVNTLGYERVIPFVDDNFSTTLALVGSVLAIAIGLKQTAWEEFCGTFRFLLYRPASIQAVFAWKLLVGTVVSLLIPALLILAYTIWAATPGNHGSPFYLSMTLEAWRLWLALPLFYLAAFLAGLRPARWLGTRLSPLIAGSIAALMLAFFPRWEVTLLGMPVVSALLISCILYVARTRDY